MAEFEVTPSQVVSMSCCRFKGFCTFVLYRTVKLSVLFFQGLTYFGRAIKTQSCITLLQRKVWQTGVKSPELPDPSLGSPSYVKLLRINSEYGVPWLKGTGATAFAGRGGGGGGGGGRLKSYCTTFLLTKCKLNCRQLHVQHQHS